MIGSLIGAGLGLAGGIFGGIRSANAAKRQRRLIREQQAKNEAWYNRNYYQNYLDSTQGRAALQRVEQTMRRNNQEAAARAAITGATHEQLAADQANNNAALGDTVAALAAQGDANRQAVDAQYQQMQNATQQQLAEQAAISEQGNAQLMNNGLGIVGQALQLYSMYKDK